MVAKTSERNAMTEAVENFHTRYERAKLAGLIGGLEPTARTDSRNEFEQSLMDRFPGQYIAYRETWDGDELKGLILAHSERYAEIDELYDRITPDESRHIRIVSPAEVFVTTSSGSIP